jgi:predicted metal-dependent peptidase
MSTLTSNTITPRELVAVARTKARTMFPSFTYQILSAITVERPGLGTLCVDKWMRIYFDPAFVAAHQNDMEYLGLAITHEVLHPMLLHFARCATLAATHPQGRELMAKAQDAAVNDLIETSGRRVPGDWITPRSLGLPSGLSAEEYFELLAKQADDKAEQQAEQQQSEGSDKGDDQPAEGSGDRSGSKEGEGESEAAEGSGSQQQPQTGQSKSSQGQAGEPQANQSNDEPGKGGEDGAAAGQGSGQAQPGGCGGVDGEPYAGPVPDRTKGEGGSGADGIQKPWEQGPPSESQPGMTEAEQKVLERVVAQAIEQQMKGRGTGQGGLNRWVQKILHPRRDPLQVLESTVRATCQTGPGYGMFTYRHPNRRQPRGLPKLPVHRQPVCRVAVLVDSSGSMGAKDLGEALGVIGRVLKKMPPDSVRIYTGDTKAGPAQKVFRPEQVKIVGGGGTDVGRMLESVAKESPEPDVILAVTDGDTPWPARKVKPRVVAYLTRRYYAKQVPVWITKIVADKD